MRHLLSPQLSSSKSSPSWDPQRHDSTSRGESVRFCESSSLKPCWLLPIIYTYCMYGTVIISRSIDICTIWQCNYTLLFWFFDGIHLHATHDYVQLLWHLEVLTQCSRLWISSYYSFQWLLANHIAHIINYIYHRNLTGCSPCFTSLMISASLSYQLARATWLMRVSITPLQIRNWI